MDPAPTRRDSTAMTMPFLRAIRRFAPQPNRAPRRWVVVFYDQLRPRHPLLTGAPADTGVLYIETTAKPERRRYHAQKLVLLLSAMRHDAEARGRAGHPVRYHVSDAWYDAAIAEARERYGLENLHALEPAEAEVREPLRTLAWLTLHPNTLFVTDATLYRRVFPKRGQRRLETFYRAARRATGLLMDGDVPAGGAWNYDAENRKAWKGDPQAPAAVTFTPDAVTREVMTLVATRYPASLGAVDGFAWPVTADEAERAADAFIVERLRWFGPFEDAMAVDAPELFHSTLSAPLNLGLLDPLALCRRVESAFRSGVVPLASAEGFVRQVLGWREFVRHVYEEHRAHYATANALAADLPLPPWYWGEPSGLHCLDTVVAQVLARGYSHHIPRLMVLSNIATLLGVDPQALNRWFWEAYVDAYEWVVTPNVVGMATWADGGIVGSKPYVSSGKYILRMGPSLCAGCRFDPATTSGATACPLNHLYWDFLDRHRARLAGNVRMAGPLAALKKLAPAVMADHRAHAAVWRARAGAGGGPPATA
jgi:deoxyribodipyrimidine photolyase-related protein